MKFGGHSSVHNSPFLKTSNGTKSYVGKILSPVPCTPSPAHRCNRCLCSQVSMSHAYLCEMHVCCNNRTGAFLVCILI